MTKSLAIIAAALLSVASSPAALVYGNMGSDGSTSLGPVNNDVGPGSGWLAQGFNTGNSSLLSLQSVTLGLFGVSTNTIPLTVSIFTGIQSGANTVPDTSLYTSAAASVGNTGKYSFIFSNALLQANTSYFIVPSGGSWYALANLFEAPIAQNGSGYSNAGTWEITSTNAMTPSGTWVTSPLTSYSLSVYATTSAPVPEPSTWAAAALLVGGAVFMRWRRSGKGGLWKYPWLRKA